MNDFNIYFLCKYCHNKFMKYRYNLRTNEKKCPSCGDTNIKLVEPDEERKDVFGYNDTKPETKLED